ncbi:MAG TPA: hypothetical protein VE988_03750 [Gemmataceae bacterium]|nr:hypothetical protein [Gemmataceae bacterium]
MTEHDPVEESETVYRRIPGVFFNGQLTIPVQREAFRPTPKDHTGLSVFRAQFAQPTDALANVNPLKVKDYFVARLFVRALLNLGLTINPEPKAEGPAGHAVIPQLTWDAYQADKERWKPILVELAKLASADIVHRAG